MRAILAHGVVVACLVAAACTRPARERPLVALVMKSLANEFFQTMERGARDHQRAHAADYDLIVNGIKDEQDVSRQVDIVDDMIARHVDAIVIAPADSKALVPVCRKALDSSIVVVNVDNRFDRAALADRGARIPFVGPDNRKGARAVGEHLARRLEPGDAVAIVEGAPNAFNAIQRTQGFRDAMDAAGMKIVTSQTAYWETDRAHQVTSAILTRHPSLKALLCANDSMALGAVAAVRGAGREGHVLVAGFDNISAVRQLVTNGRIVATADQHADRLAVHGIEYALEIIRTKSRPSDRETPVDLITAEKGPG